MKALIVNTTPIAREILGDALDDTILHGLCEAWEWLESLGIGSGVSYVEPYVTYPCHAQLPQGQPTGARILLEYDYYPVVDGYIVKARLRTEYRPRYDTVDVDVAQVAARLGRGEHPTLAPAPADAA